MDTPPGLLDSILDKLNTVYALSILITLHESAKNIFSLNDINTCSFIRAEYPYLND